MPTNRPADACKPCDQSFTDLAARYERVRAQSMSLVEGLQPEDCVVQSMPDTSPTKWHLAHTSWFFEEFVLGARAGHQPLQPGWSYLFNSYYQSVGPMHARGARGLLTRPTLAQVFAYRAAVDECVVREIERGIDDERAAVLAIGLQHEQQHQELILTDILHTFSINPLEPVFRARVAPVAHVDEVPMVYIDGPEGIVEMGARDNGFAFDNERPRHRTLLQPHAIANRPVNNGEFRAFVEAGGYRNASLWLSEGWNTVQRNGWQRPFYWSEDLDKRFTLGGRVRIDPLAPVCHVSFFEADAFARWAGKRLPTEAEWETLAAAQPARDGNFVESGAFVPLPPNSAGSNPRQLFGDVWEWTSSPYVAYPGFKPLGGSLGEYNGKFMSGQWILRGGSCATPA
ncbi:ergothioneine biosynthesis protein EgtB, partial [Dokdonella sp.]|uniref:ergothioneine biosynthesis protein EgtB n=1 Tax=Dokdonella sp. TaxID=2291710 RepID=UPI0032655486